MTCPVSRILVAMRQAGFLLLYLCLGFANAQNNNGNSGMVWSRGEDCFRPCGGRPRICYWEFVVERYSVMGPACRNCSQGNMAQCWSPQCVVADGFNKGILTVNRQIPGPLIQVCLNDMIVVDVSNRMTDYTTSIHWHGIRMMGTPHMDGVPMVTQCPIQPFTTFRYRFQASEAGTFFWHSHTGSQKLDGISGGLVVRTDPRNDIQGRLYDEDRHVIVLQDWTRPSSDYYTPGPHLEDVVQVPDSILINGLGPISINGTNRRVPMANFTVTRGRRHRIRIIGATCMTCAFAVRIQGHRLLAISADGALNFRPTPVDSIIINSADRFDAILEANQTEGIYYLTVESINDFCRGIRQVAVIRYSSMGNRPPNRPIPPPAPLGVQLNHPNSTCDGRNRNEICVSMLDGESHAPTVRNFNGPYFQYHVAFGFYTYDVDDLFAPGTYQHYEEPIYGRLIKSLVNNASFGFPSSPMLSQFNDIPSNQFCNRECYTEDIQKACTCTNFYRIDLNSIVDLIVFDTGERDGFDHPFHLHGYNFYILEMGVFSETRENRQRHLDAITRRAATDNVNLRLRPMRDTISIPSRGYVIIRFIADNPGYWLMHCHFAYHVESGMAAVYKVGNDNQIPSTPRGFPTCGNFYGN